MSIREDVYRRLEGFALMRGLSMSDAIAELLSEHQSLAEIKELLRQCLDNLGRQTTTLASPQLVNTHEIASEATESRLISFEGNPWVQIIRAKVTSDESEEGH